MLYEKIVLSLALALLCCVAVAQNIGPNNDPFVKVPVLSIDDYTLGGDAVFTIPVNLTLPSNYPVYQKYNIWPGYWDYFVAYVQLPEGFELDIDSDMYPQLAFSGGSFTWNGETYSTNIESVTKKGNRLYEVKCYPNQSFETDFAENWKNYTGDGEGVAFDIRLRINDKFLGGSQTLIITSQSYASMKRLLNTTRLAYMLPASCSISSTCAEGDLPEFTIPAMTLKAGESKVFYIDMKTNNLPVCGLKMSIYPPTGVTLSGLGLVGNRSAGDITWEYDNYDQTENCRHISIQSPSMNYSFSGSSGHLSHSPLRPTTHLLRVALS